MQDGSVRLPNADWLPAAIHEPQGGKKTLGG
jgi:hypothetical protein